MITTRRHHAIVAATGLALFALLAGAVACSDIHEAKERSDFGAPPTTPTTEAHNPQPTALTNLRERIDMHGVRAQLDHDEAVRQQRLAAARAKAAASRAAAGQRGNVAPSGDVWSRLAFCESGGDPSKNTGNGYYGAFQFSLSTWRSVGGTGYPHEHSYGEQLHRAQILQARSGWGQWPACSRKLGLR